MGVTMIWRRIVIMMAGVFLLFTAGTALAQANPQQELKQAIDEGLEILKQSGLNDDQRVAKLRTVVYPLFDFPEMAKRSLGSHWRKRTPEQQREFTELFTNLLEKTYAKNIASYDGQQVVYTGEKLDGKYAQVDTKIVDKNGREFEVDYRMFNRDNRWRIYDVVIENISLVNNYRAQFNRVITRNSYDQLVDRMRGKAG
jgi:phospholipid transport system substrate-binding protein